MNLAVTIDFLKRRAAELSGIGLLILGPVCLIAFLTYNPADPSLNVATDNDPTNWAGHFGAFIAGPIIEVIGLGSVAFVLVPPAWGWILYMEKSFPRWWLRTVMLAVCLPLMAGAFAGLDKVFDIPGIWPSSSFGGVIGGVAINDPIIEMVTLPAFLIFTAIFAAVTFYIAAGLNSEEWEAVLRSLYKPIELLFAGLNKLLDIVGVAKTKARNKKQRIKKKKIFAAEEPVKKRKLIEISKKSQAPKVAQTSLDLRVPNDYELPPLNLLKTPPARSKKNLTSESALEQNAKLLEKVLDDFGIHGEIVKVRPGPVVTLYELEPSPGTKSARVIGLSDDIARSMSAVSARISVIPGKNVIGIELPNSERETVYFRPLLESDEFEESDSNLGLVLGKTLEGEPFIMDLAKMPHLLIAGTTGSGKSVGLNAMVLSLLYRYTPDECKFIMIDPKMLELSVYDGIPHLLSPVVTEPKKAVVALKWTVKEMENRYRLMSNLGVRNVEGYNKRIMEAKASGEELMRTIQTGYDMESGKPTFEKVPLETTPLPFIVVVVDEMADLMIVAGKEIESSIQRLAQMARAAGIHIIMATQRPSVDVITGVIKANFPTRISFQVTSRVDSRTILGEQGAEQLLGMGDMLYMAGGNRITRVHGPYVDDKEVEKVVKFWKEQGDPIYIEDVTVDDEEGDMLNMTSDSAERDDLYDKAVEIVLRDGRASTSYVQRCLKIGYNRAANIIEQMEKDGIVSEAGHTGKREVLTGS